MDIEDGESESGIPSHRYEGYSLHEKFDWVQHGHGPAAAEEVREGLSILADAMAESDLTLRSALRPLGIEWQGAAAVSAGAAFALVADWSLVCGVSAHDGGIGVAVAGAGFATVRVQVETPGSVVGGASIDVLTGPFGGQFDRTQVAEADRARDDAANRALYAYEDTVRDAIGSLPSLAAPPVIAISVSASATTRSPAGRGHGDGHRVAGHPCARAADPGSARTESRTPVSDAQPPAAVSPTRTGGLPTGYALPAQQTAATPSAPLPTPAVRLLAPPPQAPLIGGASTGPAGAPPIGGPRTGTGSPPSTGGGTLGAGTLGSGQPVPDDRRGARAGNGAGRTGRVDDAASGAADRPTNTGSGPTHRRDPAEEASGELGFAAVAGVPAALGLSNGTVSTPSSFGNAGPPGDTPGSRLRPRGAAESARPRAAEPDRFDPQAARQSSATAAAPAEDVEPDHAGFDTTGAALFTVDGLASLAPAVLGADTSGEPQ
ncbi:hypothetical protein UA74_04530 [Actinoalloteichus fjordicus]|uniref:Uncharacterized protein n=2 Tax=Actinoalloteichus fjordicus TaxID=1612552 RepID=A0AAC9LAS9_9PSEU|nr:hypothetical protein UA74_04530 [Actinoalloteichus fjordicus]